MPLARTHEGHTPARSFRFADCGWNITDATPCHVVSRDCAFIGQGVAHGGMRFNMDSPGDPAGRSSPEVDLMLDRCEIHGRDAYPNEGDFVIAPWGFTLRRCNLHHWGRGAHADGGSVTVEET